MVIILKENGCIRKIDELGRIVIPRDIRKKLHILSSDSLNISIVDSAVKIEKYSVLTSVVVELNRLLSLAKKVTGNDYIIFDNSRSISASADEYKEINTTNEIKLFISNTAIKIDKITLGEKIYNSGDFNITAINIDSANEGVLLELCNNKTNNYIILLLKEIIENRLNNY